MQNPKKFLKITLPISLFGIFLLILISNTQEPKAINIEQISNNLSNKKIKVQGEIFNIKSFEDSNFQVISIKDPSGKIDITADKILNLTNSQKIIVIGKVQEYKQYLQIQADKIIIN